MVKGTVRTSIESIAETRAAGQFGNEPKTWCAKTRYSEEKGCRYERSVERRRRFCIYERYSDANQRSLRRGWWLVETPSCCRGIRTEQRGG